MKKRPPQHTAILYLAYAHRYLYPFAVILLAFAAGPDLLIPVMGAGLLLLGAYGLVGYNLRWKHIYCSWQLSHHLPMTPEKIDWKKYTKREAQTTSAVLAALGLVMLLGSLFFT